MILQASFSTNLFHTTTAPALRCNMLTHMADIHQRDLLSGMHDAFGSSKYSDLCVHCEDDTYNLHRLIVCQRSRFFAACCDGDFKVRNYAQILSIMSCINFLTCMNRKL
jgi:hypothetical protein